MDTCVSPRHLGLTRVKDGKTCTTLCRPARRPFVMIFTSMCLVTDMLIPTNPSSMPTPLRGLRSKKPDLLLLRQGRRIDGLSLLAAAKRYGICILVVPCSLLSRPEGPPYVRFGDWRAGNGAVVLLLKDGHYQLARLKLCEQLPRKWTEAKVAEGNHSMIRAGGASWRHRRSEG